MSEKELSQDELMETFIKVLSDTYMLKRFLLVHMPELTYKVQRAGLKMLIVHSGCSLNAQIIRMDVALKSLKRTILADGALPSDGLNLEKFLFNGIDVQSLYNDTKLINHLMLIVGIEVNSFRLLELLSKPLYPRLVNRLMKLNLKDAVSFQKKLINTYHSYLEINLQLK